MRTLALTLPLALLFLAPPAFADVADGGTTDGGTQDGGDDDGGDDEEEDDDDGCGDDDDATTGASLLLGLGMLAGLRRRALAGR